jgi:hypothetical protein
MAEKQSWETCKYSVAAGAGDMGHELKEHGLYELYGCDNESISGLYPLEHIRDGASYVKAAVLHRIGIADELTKEQAAADIMKRNRSPLSISRQF